MLDAAALGRRGARVEECDHLLAAAHLVDGDRERADMHLRRGRRAGRKAVRWAAWREVGCASSHRGARGQDLATTPFRTAPRRSSQSVPPVNGRGPIREGTKVPPTARRTGCEAGCATASPAYRGRHHGALVRRQPGSVVQPLPGGLVGLPLGAAAADERGRDRRLRQPRRAPDGDPLGGRRRAAAA